jgi:hypothetical protein
VTTSPADLPFPDRFGEGRNDSPYWNESVWFSISVPERRLHGFIQYYFRPNMGMLNGGPVLWDPSGQSQWNCLYYQWSHLQAMPVGAEKFDMTARNSLSVKVLEPMTRYSISYDKEDLRLELEWTAVAPMHELHTSDGGGEKTYRFHMEQPGRLRGTAVLNGETIAIDCHSMRDTSYGERSYDSLRTGGYFWGIADGSAFHAIAMGEGTEQTLSGGFIWRDGELASLAAGTRWIDEFGEFGPKTVRFDATDTLGRRVLATGHIDPGLIWTGYTDHTVVWSLLEWDVDGVTHWGDNQEFTPAMRFRHIARGLRELGT